ncbi:hypothetical protein FIBSPDRAFT_959105 [Athelia psychrophila]|uniref:Uncharacterized protein n=1 Tax=Athelia psychrophila TaxID=1759441 RepID=A0A166DW79_9AGAM|nr:hypothetical protein FIBSPDRAFT_959105 [Fibularhizoctonia sp. CBS 109695]
MEALFEGLPELLEEGGEGTIEEAIQGGVESQAEAFANLVVDGVADGEEVVESSAEAMADGATEIKEAVAEGKSIAQTMQDGMKSMWDSKTKFANFIGKEVAKGALLVAGMKAMEQIMTTAAAAKPQSPVLAKRAVFIQGINKAEAIIDPIIKEWSAWLTKNFDKRDSYGEVPVPGMDISISRVQILQSQLSSFDAAQDKIHPLVMAAQQTEDVASVQALLDEWKKYVNSVLKLTTDIRDNEPKMVADGLKDHNDDVQAAYTALLLVV